MTDCHRLFGDFQVTLKKREVKDKYVVSSIQLKVRASRRILRMLGSPVAAKRLGPARRTPVSGVLRGGLPRT